MTESCSVASAARVIAAAGAFAGVLLAPSGYAATTPAVFTQGPKLVAGDAIGGAQQGVSVALSADGNTAVVGGMWDDSLHGAAWAFTRAGGVWTHAEKLIGTGASAEARQGFSVALSADGNTALVGGFQDGGGTGAAWVFARSNGVFAQQGNKLVGTGGSGSGGSSQGTAVALSADGNTALVGGGNDGNGTGAAWVFTRSGGVWTQQGSKLFGSGAVGTSNQGDAVALSADGSTAVVGGPGDDTGAGAVWVFTRSNGVWTQQGGKLAANDATPGIVYQGASVDVSSDGSTLVFGGPGDSSSLGAAWVFTRSGGVWTQQGGKLVGNVATASGQQGTAVGLSGDGATAVVGAPNGIGGGGAWVFTRSADTWTQRGGKYTGTGAIGDFSRQGAAVAVSSDGGTALVGGPYDDLDSNVGAAWVLDRIAAAPTKGDVNGDGAVDVADVFYLIGYLFAGGPAPH